MLIKVRISFCPVFKKMIKIMNDNSSVYFHALFTCLLTCSLSTFKVCATLRCKLISLVFVIKFMMVLDCKRQSLFFVDFFIFKYSYRFLYMYRCSSQQKCTSTGNTIVTFELRPCIFRFAS